MAEDVSSGKWRKIQQRLGAASVRLCPGPWTPATHRGCGGMLCLLVVASRCTLGGNDVPSGQEGPQGESRSRFRGSQGQTSSGPRNPHDCEAEDRGKEPHWAPPSQDEQVKPGAKTLDRDGDKPCVGFQWLPAVWWVKGQNRRRSAAREHVGSPRSGVTRSWRKK